MSTNPVDLLPMLPKTVLSFVLDTLISKEYIIKTGKGNSEKWYVQLPLDLDGEGE